ncbi:MAG: hypothetical protein QXG01_05845, partial [Candidatus Bathyarchaeia archaeon]
MKNTTMFSLILLITLFALIIQLSLCFSKGAIAEIVPPIPSEIFVPPLKFKETVIEASIVNATHLKIRISAEIANPYNQAIVYAIRIVAPLGYAKFQPKMEIKAVTEKVGKLDITIDRWGNAKAISRIEAKEEDAIFIEGWILLAQDAQNSRMIWRESIMGSIEFSITPETGYEARHYEGEEIRVKLTYPAEYTKADETNYRVKYDNGFKIIEYTEEFYGSFWLSFDMYKPRTPIKSLTVFLALWLALILFVVKRK